MGMLELQSSECRYDREEQRILCPVLQNYTERSYLCILRTVEDQVADGPLGNGRSGSDHGYYYLNGHYGSVLEDGREDEISTVLAGNQESKQFMLILCTFPYIYI